ncbi:MAG: response regulator [Bacteroidales bacterium]|nr:response regulator [Bacteroidales bacterium]
MSKILIIEDTDELRDQMADVLQLEGFEVTVAANGYLGVQQALKSKPDLILCDIMMPGISGYDVFQLIKDDATLSTVPFVYITALSERSSYRKGMDLGADDYLVKPFTIEELLGAIQTRLKKKQNLENQINTQLESIESQLKGRINELQHYYDHQKRMIEEVNATNAQIISQLNEKQSELMNEALRSIEVNVTLQTLGNQLAEEINRPGISLEQKLALSSLRKKIKKGSMLLDNWTVFQLKFNQTYPNFSTKLLIQYPHLTQQDLVIISAMFINLNSFQLSAILGISPESVRKSKYRLKKKLGLKHEDDLLRTIHKLNTP